jgi:arginine decarboxylase
MKEIIPTCVFLIRGVGRHGEKLVSFELALRDACIARFNLVRVSSIFPPGCKVISREKGLAKLTTGGIVYCVMAESATNEPHRIISASIGLAVPGDPRRHGYLSEHHGLGQTDEEAGNYAEDLAAQMLATILGLPFDADSAYDVRK